MCFLNRNKWTWVTLPSDVRKEYISKHNNKKMISKQFCSNTITTVCGDINLEMVIVA